MSLSFTPGPNLAFVLTLFGLLLVYCEFVWPGKMVPGILGALMTMFGIYGLSGRSVSAIGTGLIAAGMVCFGLEAALQTYFIAGAAASILLACGFWKLYASPPWIVASLAFPLSLLFGTNHGRLAGD